MSEINENSIINESGVSTDGILCGLDNQDNEIKGKDLAIAIGITFCAMCGAGMLVVAGGRKLWIATEGIRHNISEGAKGLFGGKNKKNKKDEETEGNAK